MVRSGVALTWQMQSLQISYWVLWPLASSSAIHSCQLCWTQIAEKHAKTHLNCAVNLEHRGILPYFVITTKQLPLQAISFKTKMYYAETE